MRAARADRSPQAQRYLIVTFAAAVGGASGIGGAVADKRERHAHAAIGPRGRLAENAHVEIDPRALGHKAASRPSIAKSSAFRSARITAEADAPFLPSLRIRFQGLCPSRERQQRQVNALASDFFF